MVSALSAVISSASTHDINLVTDVVDNAVIKRPIKINIIIQTQIEKEGKNKKVQHLCLDKAYISEQEEQELIRRGYVTAH